MADGLKPPELLTSEELARLAECARLDVHAATVGTDANDEEDDDVAAERLLRSLDFSRATRGAIGLRFAARAYAVRGDEAGLVPAVWGAWALTASCWDFGHGIDFSLERAVKACAPRLAEIDGLAERLAKFPVGAVREELARSLPDVNSPVLRALARDVEPNVRKAAATRIGQADDFPASTDGHTEEVLAAARGVLTMSSWDLGQKPILAVKALAPLSDALALACWERLLAVEGVWEKQAKAWLPRLVALPGGGAALARVAEAWEPTQRALFAADWLTRVKRVVGEKARRRATEQILARIRELDALPDSEGQTPPHLLHHLAECAVKIAPDRGDARVLLETMLGCSVANAHKGKGSWAHMVSTLSPLLSRWPLGKDIRCAMRDARRAGKPGRWNRLDSSAWKVLGPDPVLRRQALHELDSRKPHVRSRAVSALLDDHRIPEKDGTQGAVARRLFARPELRLPLINQAKQALPLARRALLRGELDLEATAYTLDETDEGHPHAEALWRVAREARDRALCGSPAARRRALEHCRSLIRGGPTWDSSDLAYAKACADAALAGDEPTKIYTIVLAVSAIEAPETAALLKDIESRVSTDAMREWFGKGIERARMRP